MSKLSFCYIEITTPYYTNQSEFMSVNQSINQSINSASVKFKNQFPFTSINQTLYPSINRSMSKPVPVKFNNQFVIRLIRQILYLSINQSMSQPSFCYIELSIPYYTNKSDFTSVNQSINE